MKQTFFAAAVSVLMAISTHGQTSATAPSCTLKVASAPTVRGLKLGMKQDEIFALFPGRAEQPDLAPVLAKRAGYPDFGVVRVWIWPSQLPSNEQFAGIDTVAFTLIDDKLVRYYVQYAALPKGPSWRNVDDFIGKVADAFHLPPAQNWAQSQNSSQKELSCDGFRVLASNQSLQGQIIVEMPGDPDQVKRERLAAFEAKAKRDFKP